MHKFKLIIAILSITLFSCSKENNFLLDEVIVEKSESDEEIPVFNSLEEMINYYEIKKTVDSYVNPVVTKAQVTTHTVYGNTRLVKTRGKGMFTAKYCEAYGLRKNVVYIYDLITAYYEVSKTTNDNPIIMDSPNCGEAPGSGTSYTRGYAITVPEPTKFMMYTYLIHIISDASGISYNLYKPINPNQLEWNYGIFRY